MALPNDSILVTPGSGATVPTHLVSGKEYEVVMQADADGHIQGSKDLYFFRVPNQVHVASANTKHWDLFNADSTLLVRVLSIIQIPDAVTAVTGVGFTWQLTRTTAVGTGGTALTAILPDLSQTALSSNITCRSKPTGGATTGVVWRQYHVWSEETNASVQLYAALNGGGIELIPRTLQESGRGILLRQNQGLQVLQVTSSSAGNTEWLISFTVE
jgi:hypothetical protein